ncbi:hypothetical protein PI125_g18538 [Phytophthora idaei]|nr:hypothetical protein PI125_g18538 [Phytophthora idaei]
MQDEDAYVVVRTKETLWCVKLTQPSALLKVDPLNKALQPGTGVSSTALNVHEVLLLQNRLGGSFRQSRSIAPATCPTFRHPLVKLLAIPALYSTVVLSGLARLRFRKGRSLSLFMPIANSFSASASITTRYPMKRSAYLSNLHSGIRAMLLKCVEVSLPSSMKGLGHVNTAVSAYLMPLSLDAAVRNGCLGVLERFKSKPCTTKASMPR